MKNSIENIRSERLQGVMQNEGLDILILYGNAWQNDYLRYAADFGILEGEGIAIVKRNEKTILFLDDQFEFERASIECPDLTIEYASDIVTKVSNIISELDPSEIASAPYRHMPFGFSEVHERNGIIDATELIDRLLMVKAQEELSAIRRAAQMADEGYSVFLNAAKPGIKDYALVAEVEAFFRSSGVDDNFMIIGVGGPEVRGMAPPSGKILKEGDLVTTELTPCVDGYYAQICRTLVVGPPSKSQKNAFSIFHEATVAGIDAIKNGITASDIAMAENNVFRHYKLGDYVTSEYTRVRGHGLGLFPDTKPHILEGVNTPIENGMVMIVHPNTYHPDVGYMVFGDTVIVGPNGAEVLTKTDRVLFSTDTMRSAS